MSLWNNWIRCSCGMFNTKYSVFRTSRRIPPPVPVRGFSWLRCSHALARIRSVSGYVPRWTEALGAGVLYPEIEHDLQGMKSAESRNGDLGRLTR